MELELKKILFILLQFHPFTQSIYVQHLVYHILLTHCLHSHQDHLGVQGIVQGHFGRQTGGLIFWLVDDLLSLTSHSLPTL